MTTAPTRGTGDLRTTVDGSIRPTTIGVWLVGRCAGEGRAMWRIWWVQPTTVAVRQRTAGAAR